MTTDRADRAANSTTRGAGPTEQSTTKSSYRTLATLELRATTTRGKGVGRAHPLLLLERARQVLREPEMRRDRGAQLDEVGFEVGVRRVDDELLVERLQQGLVFADLRVGVVVVEVRACFGLEHPGDALGIAVERLARRARLTL